MVAKTMSFKYESERGREIDETSDFSWMKFHRNSIKNNIKED